MIRLGILGSTRGTNMQPIMEAIRQKRLPAMIEIVISNKSDALILERARSFGLNAQFVNPKGLTREAFDRNVSHLLAEYAVDLVVLIGYMRILSGEFVTTWQNKIINVHPSLLPAFSGKMDLDVHQAVIDAGVSETGIKLNDINTMPCCNKTAV